MSGVATTPSVRWRVVDIVVAAVIAVACGVIFFAWNQLYEPVTTPLGVLLPGSQSLLYGIWLLAGPLAAFVVRKPGAALFAELVAATLSALLGAAWGPLTLEAGLVQGLAAELVFLAFRYRVWTLPVMLLAGATAGLAMGFNDLIIFYPAYADAFKVVYVAGGTIGGALIAGLGAWLLVRALAATGVLHRFAVGRDTAERV